MDHGEGEWGEPRQLAFATMNELVRSQDPDRGQPWEGVLSFMAVQAIYIKCRSSLGTDWCDHTSGRPADCRLVKAAIQARKEQLGPADATDFIVKKILGEKAQ